MSMLDKHLTRKRDKNNRTKYAGEYVAFDGFNSEKVIAHGKDAGEVTIAARKTGVAVPTIVFVPNPDVTYIYSVA